MSNLCDSMGLRECYRWLPILETLPDSEYKDREIVATKRRARRLAKRSNLIDLGYGAMERRIIKDYGIDGFVELVCLPEVISSKESADEFFEEFMRMECEPSMYDCTGQAFTNWHKTVKRRGNYWVYHSVSFDV